MLKVMTKTPQFMCSKHLNCQIISIYCHHPKVPSSTGTRPRGIVLVSAVRHRVSRIRAHLSVSHCGEHQLNIDIFFHRFIFIAVTAILHKLFMYSLVFIMFKLSRLGSCWNNYLAFLSNFAACMRPRRHPELLLLILVIILERELQLHFGES